MKQLSLLVFICLWVSFSSFSQIKKEKSNGIFYKISLASTLTVNKNYSIGNDEGETLINPGALFANNTIGYQFDKRALIGLNIEYDWHWEQNLHFLPAYLGFQYNILPNDTDFFIRGGYGTFLGLSKDFEKGNLYKLGLGFRIYNEDDLDSILIGLDFTRKRFGHKTLESLSSVSIFIEYMLF
tara:strand:+ start:65280 stop:65828 length:549 start_codon:yes stop_codon:yes gene_type:complete